MWMHRAKQEVAADRPAVVDTVANDVGIVVHEYAQRGMCMVSSEPRTSRHGRAFVRLTFEKRDRLVGETSGRADAALNRAEEMVT